MFDTYNNETKYVSVNSHVKEMRAPTDESVRLLAEMEKAAKDKIISTIHVQDTHFDAKLYVWDNYLNLSFDVGFVLTLNGKRIVIESKIAKHKTEEQIMDQIVSDIADRIAVEVLQKPIMEAVKSNSYLFRK